MEETILSESLRASLTQRLRDLHPYMRIDAVHSLVSRCSQLLEDGVQEQQQATEEAKARTSLFSLPPELRNRIYEVALVPDPAKVNWQRGSRGRSNCVISLGRHYQPSNETEAPEANGTLWHDKWAFQPALTRTCRQVRKETLPVYYGMNDFVTNSDQRNPGFPRRMNEISFEEALRWLKAIGPENRSLLTTLTIRGGPLTREYTSARRFLALMVKEGIHLPEDVVASVYNFYPVADGCGGYRHGWVLATPEIEEQYSQFGDEPGLY